MTTHNNQNDIEVFCENNHNTYHFPQGTSLAEALESIRIKLPYTVVSAKVNNKTESLNYRFFSPKNIRFLDISHPAAMRVYTRSLCFILAKAVHEVLPNTRISIEHPISKGYFCLLSNNKAISKEIIEQIKLRMKEIVSADIPFNETETHREIVAEIFYKQKLSDKALLLETLDDLYAKYYELDGYIDYFYGTLAPSTRYINLFDLEQYNDGLLLRVPDSTNPNKLAPRVEQQKMYDVYQDHLQLSNIIGIRNVGDLNKTIENNTISNIINIAEAYQEKQIGHIADRITSQFFSQGTKIVLIAGPSSSGKTTFRKRLEIQLLLNGVKPLGISLDDYFVDREKTPLDENGEYDFESLYAINLPQLNRDLSLLFQGKTISVPTFNFNTGKQEINGHFMKMEQDNILIIEGIHGLNPLLTEEIPNEKKFNIYVSALTAISLDNHNWISTTDNRLIRRIIRDARYRSYSATQTISRWRSVRKGEEKWIFPYQENAHAMFNSAMIYEFSALRSYAEPILRTVSKNTPEYAEAYRLLRFLSYFKHINTTELPSTSLLREFLGGSSFQY